MGYNYRTSLMIRMWPVLGLSFKFGMSWKAHQTFRKNRKNINALICIDVFHRPSELYTTNIETTKYLALIPACPIYNGALHM